MCLRSSLREVGLAFERKFEMSMANAIDQDCQYYIRPVVLYIKYDLIKPLHEVSKEHVTFLFNAKQRCKIGGTSNGTISGKSVPPHSGFLA